jgi:molecular chaperone DnaK
VSSSFAEKSIEKLRIDFERIKIDEADEIEKGLLLYLKKRHLFNKSKLKMDGMELSPSILYDAFEKVVLPSLSASLDDIRKYISDNNIDIEDSGSFRLVFAGGFSSFYLVRKTVLDAFRINEESDPRNDQCFTLTDTALAISKGAALIAHNDFKIEYVCPIDIGVIVTEVTTGKRREISILKKGVLINKYKKPIFAGEKFIINENPDNDTMMIFFYEKNGCRVDKKIGVLSHNLLPNANKANYWDVGFSVDEDLMFYFHAKDKDNSISTVQLGSVLQVSE